MARILLAEDEDVLRMLIVDTLEEYGYEIDVASDGIEAMEKIEGSLYDLAILDYMMPGLTGIEVIEKIRQHPVHHSLKTMIVTAKSQKSDEERAKLAGADYFIRKPFSPLVLSKLVKEILT